MLADAACLVATSLATSQTRHSRCLARARRYPLWVGARESPLRWVRSGVAIRGPGCLGIAGIRAGLR